MVSVELWLIWSDKKGFYESVGTYDNDRARERAKLYNQRGANGAHDWRPVRIPTPRQLEAAADLLAALKLILESTDSDAIGQYESDAAYAAIAKANGEGE